MTISTEFCHGEAGHGMDKQYPILHLSQNFAMAKQNMARTSSTHFDHFYRILPWQSRTWQGQAVPTLTISTEFCHGKAEHGKDKQYPLWPFLQNFAMTVDKCLLTSCVRWTAWSAHYDSKVHACLTVTCHLHFWQNDWDHWHDAAATRGGTDTEIRVSTKGEKNSLAASAGTHAWPSTHKSGTPPMSYASAQLRTDWMQFPILCLYP